MEANEDRARCLAEVYSSNARGYAQAWSPVIRPAGRALLQALPWAGARRVLDVGTGTGALLGDIRRLAPRARIAGVDRSLGMLEVAREHRLPLAVMDAGALALRDGAVDVVVMAFVLFHLDDPVATVRETGRVLCPGGAVGTVTWAEEPEFEASRVWEEELDAHGAMVPSPTPEPNHAPMNSPEKVAGLFREAGLLPGRAWIEPVRHQWDLPTLTALRTTFGRSKQKLESLDPPARARFLARVRDRLSRLDPDAFLYRASAVCAVARQPD